MVLGFRLDRHLLTKLPLAPLSLLTGSAVERLAHSPKSEGKSSRTAAIIVKRGFAAVRITLSIKNRILRAALM
jgi:hypothetical protein